MLKLGPRLTTSERILVRLPSWLGDLVMCEPALRALVARYTADGVPERVSIAAPRHLLPILDGAFEGVRRIPHEGRGGERAADWRGHDAALLFTNSFRSAWTSWRAGIPRRIGWARDGRGLLLTDSMRPALRRGGVPLGIGVRGSRYLPRPFGGTCIELLGLLGISVFDTRPRLVSSPAEIEAVRERLAREGLPGLPALPGLPGPAPFLLANVGVRPDSAKGYPPERWAWALTRLVGESKLPLVLVAGPGEESSLHAVAVALEDLQPITIVDPVADLRELVALTSLAALLLTADSGPRHLAVATGTPVVCVTGPTDPRHTADHLETTRLERIEISCGPCHLEVCPEKGEQHLACMRGVDPDRLVEAAIDLLSRRPDPPIPSREVSR
jgi:heptosyltransferase II